MYRILLVPDNPDHVYYLDAMIKSCPELTALACFLSSSLSSAQWGLPQTRKRVYFILVRADLASQQMLQVVFGNMLKNLILPDFAKSTVKEARQYSRDVCSTLLWDPVVPPPAEDKSLGFPVC